MYPCRYPPTCWPGIGIAPCAQVAAWHRSINMQADTDPRPRPTTGRINMQVTRTDTAKPSQIDPGRDRASSPIVGHQKHLHDVRRGAHDSRTTRGTGLRITRHTWHIGQSQRVFGKRGTSGTSGTFGTKPIKCATCANRKNFGTA